MTLPKTFVRGFHDETAVKNVHYNRLGKTNLEVSQLGIGGAAFCSLFGDLKEDAFINVIQKAIKSGINYIDTAPYYGQGVSEEIIGKAIKEIPRESYYIATKVGRYELDLSKRFDFTAEKTAESIDTSLKRLGLKSVDIIQIHDCDHAPSVDYVVNVTLAELQKAVDAGKARHIGITGYDLNFLKKVVENSKIKISTVLNYARNSLIDSSLLDFVPFFESNNVGIISGAAPVMGLLTNKGPQPWHPIQQDRLKICREAAQFCKSQGVELARLAVWYSSSQAGIATHLVGSTSLQELESNLDVVNNGLTAKEKEVYSVVRQKYITGKPNWHWEGKDITEHWDLMKSLPEHPLKHLYSGVPPVLMDF